MYKCEIEFANIGLSWRFPRMVPALPSPFTESFGFMVKELAPFGLTPRSVNLESQGTSLEDAAISITLLNFRLIIRLTYGGVEVEGKDIYSDDVIQILQILKVIFDTLEKVDQDTKLGNGNVKASLHLKLQTGDIDSYLGERISATVNHKHIKPEAAIFNLDFDEITKQFPLKITMAKSVAFDNGLFLEINYRVNGAADVELKEPSEFMARLAEHYQVVLSTLDLELQQEES